MYSILILCKIFYEDIHICYTLANRYQSLLKIHFMGDGVINSLYYIYLIFVIAQVAKHKWILYFYLIMDKLIQFSIVIVFDQK